MTYAGHGSDFVTPALDDFAARIGRTPDDLTWSFRGNDLDLEQPGKGLTVFLFAGRTLIARRKAVVPVARRTWSGAASALKRCVLVSFRSSLGPGLDYGASWPLYDRIGTIEQWRNAILVAAILGAGLGAVGVVTLAVVIGVVCIRLLNLPFWNQTADGQPFAGLSRSGRPARRPSPPHWSMRRPVKATSVVTAPIDPSLARPWPIDVLRLVAHHASTPTFDDDFDVTAIDGMIALDCEAIEAWCVAACRSC